jgi:phosphopantothenoylcysteine decarboxylase/phosphopantothenate--cysteine ligase
MAAAVADYRPVAQQSQKLKRSGERLTIELEPTPDILADLGRTNRAQVRVGFAAETENVAENARGKLERKNVDMIVANDVTRKDAGFDADTNIVTLFLRGDREIPLPKLSKFDVANRILDQVLEIHKQSK